MPPSIISRPLHRTQARPLPITAIVLEAAGFLAIACTIWLDELFDLPYYLFGAPRSPFRPQEAIIESGVVFLLGVIIVVFTMGLLRRHFDRLVVFCAWCHRIRVDTAWVSFEQFIRMHRADTTHGMCADCIAELAPPEAGAT
jgi:hypothetical protein